MGSRQTYAIGELCSFFKGASVPRARMLDNGDWKYIHYGDLYKGFDLYIDIDNPSKPIPYVSSGERAKEDQFVQSGDIVYVLTSETVEDLGHAFMVRNSGACKILAGTETTVMRVEREDILLPAYLNYMLRIELFKKKLRQYVTGMKVFRVHPRDIAKIEIDLPSIEEQTALVDSMDSIYDKLQLNNRLNDYLLELGDALFAKVLDECEGEIYYRPIDSFCEVKGGKRLPKGSELINVPNEHPYIRVRDLNGASVLLLTPEMLYVDDETQQSISRYIVNTGDVIISVVGTIGLTAYIGDTLNNANLTENCNKLTKFDSDLASWCYFFLRGTAGAEAVRLGTVGAVQAKLPLKNIKAIEVPFVPSPAMADTITRLNVILKTVQANLTEILALGDLRDALLPKLMSGEIDVSKVDVTQLNNHLV